MAIITIIKKKMKTWHFGYFLMPSLLISSMSFKFILMTNLSPQLSDSSKLFQTQVYF